jgi:adenosylcobinamide kinase / adenosylcobinamide-phosphate guanylyltransferase
MNSYKLNTEKIILVTGASRSGKSEFAEMLAKKSHLLVIYVATAKIDETDQEWQKRIWQHQQRRPKTWQTVMISNEKLGSYIYQASSSQCLLIDSLGTWIANFLDTEPAEWEQITEHLLTNLKGSKAHIIVVGEETGWGVIPAYPLGRLFRDRLGYLSRQIANLADTTYLVAGGHVLNLSEMGKPLSNYGI